MQRTSCGPACSPEGWAQGGLWARSPGPTPCVLSGQRATGSSLTGSSSPSVWRWQREERARPVVPLAPGVPLPCSSPPGVRSPGPPSCEPPVLPCATSPKASRVQRHVRASPLVRTLTYSKGRPFLTQVLPVPSGGFRSMQSSSGWLSSCTDVGDSGALHPLSVARPRRWFRSVLRPMPISAV